MRAHLDIKSNMLQTPKLLQSSPQFLPSPQIQSIPTCSSPLILKQCCKLSRRELAFSTGSSLLLPLLGSQTQARAEENPANTNKEDEEEKSSSISDCRDKIPTKRAFLEISSNGEPLGRIIIGIYGDNVPAGTARFIDLLTGASGISYRRKEFIKIMPNYIQHGGVRSYLEADNLMDEWEKQNENCMGTKNLAGNVGIIVRDPSKPPPKSKLVAREGKLVIDEEEVGKDPNGTEFVFVTRDSPELDDSVLVIGRVLEGMEVVKKIGEVKTVQENSTSPYFRVAKLIGDKRAVVAERGFNRPYSKVVVTNCGLME